MEGLKKGTYKDAVCVVTRKQLSHRLHTFSRCLSINSELYTISRNGSGERIQLLNARGVWREDVLEDIFVSRISPLCGRRGTNYNKEQQNGNISEDCPRS